MKTPRRLWLLAFVILRLSGCVYPGPYDGGYRVIDPHVDMEYHYAVPSRHQHGYDDRYRHSYHD